MVTAYHGTNKKFAKEILKNGFKPGTYFTNHFDSAVTMGGQYIFHVVFDEEFKYWEWISSGVITKDRILAVQKIHVKNIYYNREIQMKLSNQDKKEICMKCNGCGELEYNNDGHHLLPGGSSFRKNRKIIVCPECHGYGDLSETRKMGF